MFLFVSFGSPFDMTKLLAYFFVLSFLQVSSSNQFTLGLSERFL
jgi:hypothetical protein